MKIQVHKSDEDLALYVSREFDMEYEQAKEIIETAEEITI